MKKYFLILIYFFLFSQILFAQETLVITGKINDADNKEGLIGATVLVKGTTTGTATKPDGTFQLKTNQKLPFILIISYVGYKSQEFTITESTKSLDINLSSQNIMASEVIISASRIEEDFLKSPVSIEKLDIRAIKETPAPSFFDALENIKGVQMTTLSLGYKVPNTRGFSGTTNSRFLQMVDGADNISPGIGAPVANTVGPTELDIESVELIPGAASAIYGLNAINGISNMRTKNPFSYQGLSVYQKTGVNHVDGKDHSPSVLTETSVRYAKAFNNKWAFKINAGYMQGYDWVADNHRDLNANANASLGLTGSDNPGKDPINNYGTESGNRKTLTLNGKNYVIARTGYDEKNIVDYSIKNLKFDASLHYKINEKTEISGSYRIGQASNMYQRGNRIKLDGITIQQYKLELTGSNYFIRGYLTQEGTGNSYNVRPLGENLDRASKSDANWYSDYTKAYNTAFTLNPNDAQAHQAARNAADNHRLQPGTAKFDSVRSSLIGINNWDRGAALQLKSQFYHIEGQYDFTKFIKVIDFLVGGNFRKYSITPDGNSFVNPFGITDPSKVNDKLFYTSGGGFIQLSKKLFNDKLKITSSVRLDKIKYYDVKINPRIAAVYTLAEKHNFRVSYQNGYRFPTLFEGFSFVDNGGVRRLGGFPILSSNFQAFENSYTKISQDAFNAAVNNDHNNNKLTNEAAIEKNKGLLVKSNYTYIQPEHINSFEIGYKSVVFNDKLFIDADFYFNTYKNFIGQLDVSKPNRGVIGQNDSTVYYVSKIAKYQSFTGYRLWTNSASIVTNEGASLGLSYNFYKKFTLSGNVSYSNLVTVSSSDALIPAFNTPKWITNLSFGNREVVKNLGFNIVWRWQDSFYWQSPLADGQIPAYQVFDAQVSYKIPSLKVAAKLGASNIFNNRYYQYEGGPVIGGLYYLTLIFDPHIK